MCPLIGCFEAFCFPVDGILFERNESDRGSQGQFRFGREIWPSENSKLEFKIRREPTKATQEWVKYIFQTVQFTLHADTGKNFVKERIVFLGDFCTKERKEGALSGGNSDP